MTESSLILNNKSAPSPAAISVQLLRAEDWGGQGSSSQLRKLGMVVGGVNLRARIEFPLDLST